MVRKVDLHVHTNESDGELSPEEIVELAIKTGLKIIAITDHDTVGGCEKAIEYAKGKELEIIPGIEISCYEEEGGFIEVHVLGLFVDYTNKELLDFCEDIREMRIRQKKKMIANLRKLGFKITFEEAFKLAKHSFCRPHLAKILVEKYPERFPNVKSVFDKYLGNGKPAYVGREDKTRVKEAIELVKEAGGIPVLAHPGVFGKEGGLKLIGYFAGLGGLGVETYYPYDLICGIKKEESEEFNNLFQEYAHECKLLQSGGSDFHGGIRKKVGLGEGEVPEVVVEKIKESVKLLRI